jgi:quaternary ammonium compound-resistance protein SugE
MAWVMLIIAGILETGFAVALKLSEGFSRLWPTVAFAVCAAGSFTLLNMALKSLPVGTAYAVWTGIGAAGTAVVGMVFLGDTATSMRVVSIALIIAGVVGLNLSGASTH